MQVLGVALVVLGVFGAGWGVWISFLPPESASRARRWCGAVAAPVAIVAALVGVVLCCLPNFFSS
ncbi:MAG: hypothetical protein HYY84_18385 [Deltaproteobacteria bacterium]|nr:hypothetical protein [Deltaproteobacteria bacterium]